MEKKSIYCEKFETNESMIFIRKVTGISGIVMKRRKKSTSYWQAQELPDLGNLHRNEHSNELSNLLRVA